jgi:Rieske Fe-S protein
LEERQVSRRKLIQLGMALGLGSVGASVIAGCESGGGSAGSGETTTATGTAGGSTVGGGPEVGKGQAIARESEVAPNTAFPFTDAGTGEPGVLVRTGEGELVAYSAVCTHQRCTVVYQSQARKLSCPCHGSVFNPVNGAEVEAGPAQRPLPEIAIEVRNGEVLLA